MQYVGIQTQQSRNNLRSVFLLILFPCLVTALLYLSCYLLILFGYGKSMEVEMIPMVNHLFLSSLPYTLGVVLIWFLIAYWANTSIINSATGSKPLDRKENKRVYNLVENLCMTQGMSMPKINIIYDNSLNAFASGINDRTYTITLSEGIIKKLNDEELEAVIGHELTHIRNRDVRLLIIFMLVALLIAAIGFLFSSLMRFAISRKREYMADAGSAEMTKNPLALASALRKISVDPAIEAVERKDVAQLFIQNPKKKTKGLYSQLSGLFATHPPIEKRIEILEQF